MHLSILLPVHNELDAITRNIADINRTIRLMLGTQPYEIVIIDNDSSDGTEAAISEIIGTLSHVKYLRTPDRGRGPALKLGFSYAQGEYISVLSIDRAWDEQFIERALVLLQTGAHIVYGSKSHPASEISRPKFRLLCSHLVRFFVASTFFQWPQDTQCIKAFRKSAIPFLTQLHSYNYFAETEFFLRAKRLRIPSQSIPVGVCDQRRNSKVRLSSLGEFLAELLHFRFLGGKDALRPKVPLAFPLQSKEQ